jgi:uncharacterized protein
MPARIDIDQNKIAAFCRKWKVTEFALFGSVLRDDFSPESDVDVLLTFGLDSGWSLFELVDMKDELESMFGREVDVISRGGLRNPFRRHEILTTREVVHASP